MSSLQGKPGGLSPEHAAQFQDPAVVRAYHHRVPYAPEIFERLRELAGVESPVVLDLGCGTGDISIGLATFAGRVDAVDVSAAMLEVARGRDVPRANVRWIQAPAESMPVSGPYDLVTAGQSLPWMDWPVVFAKLKSVLKKDCFLAIVGRDYQESAWWNKAFQALITRYSTNREYERYDLVTELEHRGLFAPRGRHKSAPISFSQSVDDLIEAFHSRNGFSRDRMGDSAALFDEAAASHLSQFADGKILDLGAVAHVTWGILP
jgi:SAM-dependent methyltransferase